MPYDTSLAQNVMLNPNNNQVVQPKSDHHTYHGIGYTNPNHTHKSKLVHPS